ncbi:MAG TPA: hypothetical protein VGW35_15760 [Methylomirabilota bacterium]|jgi:predicted RNase H-like HicB family nuclease|nr:hypothetical protein [Methylomirabilota bacterium]
MSNDPALVIDQNTRATSVGSREERGFRSRADTVEEIRLPEDILERYISVALRQAVPRQLESGEWYADLPGFQGVWAGASSPKDCLDSLAEVLREWVMLKMLDRDPDLPTVDQIDLRVLYQH